MPENNPVLSAIKEVAEHGFGRVEIDIADGKIMIIRETKNIKIY